LHRNLRTRLHVAVGAVVVAAALLPVAPAAAAGDGMGCQPGRTDDGRRYSTWSGDTSGLAGGMYAQILDYSPWVQPNRDPSSAWVMIQKSNDGNVYSQVGWWEMPYGARYTFAEIGWWDGSAGRYYFTRHLSGALPLGNSYYYNVNYNPYDTQHPYQYWVNNQLVAEDPPLIPDGQLNMGEVAGETKSLSSQMPGGWQGPSETFNDTHYWWPRGSSGGWHTFYPTAGGTPSFTNRANLNGGSLVAINDKACPH